MTEYILEAGGTIAFTFHVLFMLFNLFVIYQFFFKVSWNIIFIIVIIVLLLVLLELSIFKLFGFIVG